MKRDTAAMMLLMLGLSLTSSMQGQAEDTPQNTGITTSGAKEQPVAQYFRLYRAELLQDWRNVKQTCGIAKLAHENPAVSKYIVFNDWVACGQDAIKGNAVELDFGMAPPGNGVRLGVKLTDTKALNENLGSNVEVDGNVSYNGTWTSYGYWSLNPTWSSIIYESPFIRFFGGSQKILVLPYYGEGNQAPATTVSYYSLQRTPLAARGDLPTVFRPSKSNPNNLVKITLTVQLGGHWYSLADSSVPGISTLNNGANIVLLAAPAYFEQALGLNVEASSYKTGPRLEHTDTLATLFSNHNALGAEGYSYRQFSATWAHELIFQCTNWSLPVAGDPSKPKIQRHCFELALNGGVTASAADAGNSVPFFLQPTIGGSDITGNLTIPSYADYRFRGPDAEYGTATLRYPARYKIDLPLDLEVRADTGKVGLRRNDLSVNHMRHSYSAGFALQFGSIAAVDFLYSWGGREGGQPHALLNPQILGANQSGFW
jgi:hypothetical protein